MFSILMNVLAGKSSANNAITGKELSSRGVSNRQSQLFSPRLSRSARALKGDRNALPLSYLQATSYLHEHP